MFRHLLPSLSFLLDLRFTAMLSYLNRNSKLLWLKNMEFLQQTKIAKLLVLLGVTDVTVRTKQT